MEDRPVRHGRYHPPSVQSPVDDRSGFDPLPSTAALALDPGPDGWPRPVMVRADPRGRPRVAVAVRVPGWVLVRRVAPDLPRPGIVGVGDRRQHVPVRAPRRTSSASSTASGGCPCSSSAALLVLATVVLTRIRHRSLAPWSFPEMDDIPAEVRRAVREDAPAWIVAADRGPGRPVRPGRERLASVPGRDAVGRLELERPARPRRDRQQHRPRQLPAGGAVLRRRAADLPLVRGLPRRDRGDGCGRADHPGLLPLERPARRGARARRRGPWRSCSPRIGGSPRSRRSSCAPAVAWAGCGLAADILAGGDITTLIQGKPYDNSWDDGWPWFRIASVFGTGFLPHRATTFGLPGLVVGRAAGRHVRWPAAGRGAARRRPRRAPCAVPFLRVPGRVPDRRAVRRDLGGVARTDGLARCAAVPRPGRACGALRAPRRPPAERRRLVPVRHLVERGTARGGTRGARLLLRHEPGHPGAARHRHAGHPARGASSAASRGSSPRGSWPSSWCPTWCG